MTREEFLRRHDTCATADGVTPHTPSHCGFSDDLDKLITTTREQADETIAILRTGAEERLEEVRKLRQENIVLLSEKIYMHQQRDEALERAHADQQGYARATAESIKYEQAFNALRARCKELEQEKATLIASLDIIRRAQSEEP